MKSVGINFTSHIKIKNKTRYAQNKQIINYKHDWPGQRRFHPRLFQKEQTALWTRNLSLQCRSGGAVRWACIVTTSSQRDKTNTRTTTLVTNTLTVIGDVNSKSNNNVYRWNHMFRVAWRCRQLVWRSISWATWFWPELWNHEMWILMRKKLAEFFFYL